MGGAAYIVAMTANQSLVAGRAAFAARRWVEACEQLSAADRETALAPDDLDRLGTAAYLAGDAR